MTDNIPFPVPANIAGNFDAVTIIESRMPATVGKAYDLVDGKIEKRQVANIVSGLAQSFDVATAEQMADLLRTATERTDLVLCPALWNGDEIQPCGGTLPFEIVIERELSRRLGHPVDSRELAGIHPTPEGGLIAARLRRGLQSATWVLFDADNPPGIPNDWAALDIAGRLELWEPLLPGISGLERIELYGSSARVIGPGRPDNGPTHAWLRVDEPAMLATMKAHLGVAMVVQGLSFPSPRYSRNEPGRVVGHSHRSVFDLSVFDAGRLVFCSLPEISEAMEDAGYAVRDAGVRIVNLGGGVLALSGIAMPSAEMLADYARITGESVTFAATSGALTIASRGSLTLETEIESRGRVQSFAQWLSGMRDGETVRCEAPFRASVSEAAFITRHGPDAGIVHDVGCNTTYTLDADAERNAAIAALASRLRDVLPASAVAAAIAHNQERNASDPVMQATARTAAAHASIDDLFANAAPYVMPDPAALPRRDWLMKPSHLRAHLSALLATGGVGKSSLALIEALSLVSGKPLLAPRIPVRKSRVCIMNAEDGADEMDLRIAAAAKIHGIAQADIAERLFVVSPRGLVLVRSDGGNVVAVPGMVDKMADFLKQQGIDVLFLDPLASFNRGAENSNDSMNVIVDALRKVAEQARVAIRIVHHTRKTGGSAAGVEDARGGSALIAGVRQADVLNTMTDQQASELGIDVTTRRRFFSITDGKQNYAAPSDDQWLVIEPVTLANGESVATVRPHIIRPIAAPFAVVQAAHAYLVQHGNQRADRRATGWFGWQVASLAGVPGRGDDAKRAGERWLKRLVSRGVLVEVSEPVSGVRGRAVPLYQAGTLPGADAWQETL